jgi:hypothetical protein
MKLVEPLRELFKDEVRALGLRADLVNRHRFPSPGLAIRIPGDITREKLGLLRAVDVVWLDEIRKAGLHDAIWQAFAVLLPVRTVGVRGDGRTYDPARALRAVTSTDGMTADDAPFEHAFLGRVTARPVSEALVGRYHCECAPLLFSRGAELSRCVLSGLGESARKMLFQALHQFRFGGVWEYAVTASDDHLPRVRKAEFLHVLEQHVFRFLPF